MSYRKNCIEKIYPEEMGFFTKRFFSRYEVNYATEYEFFVSKFRIEYRASVFYSEKRKRYEVSLDRKNQTQQNYLDTEEEARQCLFDLIERTNKKYSLREALK